ncbi:WG repeat-containing protein [Psychrobacter sanguinis]|uniref:WG repeat-containing protein n=1 Tax=Psychrobacter sanguinis TaxID=861445 RepID=UPI00191891BD|nr:WG repeat-containing protein [Psychrobacter sanguinis]MCC3344376.1 WG repeat-containing protein [Psychrobacter sanguinis]
MILNTVDKIEPQSNLIKFANRSKRLAFNSSRTIKSLSFCAALGAISVPAYACQVPKSYYSNVFCTSSSEYFLALKDSGQPVALIDKKGRRVADLSRYNGIDVSKFKDGLIPVQRMGRVGYINTAGREVIPAIYDVITGDGKNKGWARAVNNNRIVVKKAGNFGVIDTKNRVIVPFSGNYQNISDFSGNLATITTRNGTQWVDINGIPTNNPVKAVPARNDTMTASSSNNKTSTPLKRVVQTPTVAQSTTITQSPITNSSYANSEIWQVEQRDGKWGFVNSNGVPMIKFLFEQAAPFSEGLAGVRMENKWGFVNLAGELIIPFKFEESKVRRNRGATYKGVQPFVFTGGKAWVGNAPNGAQMCVDTKGDFVGC